VEVKFDKEKKQATYTLTTTIMLQLEFNHPSVGNIDLSGNATRKVFVLAKVIYIGCTYS